jgi:hypothetical protein
VSGFGVSVLEDEYECDVSFFILLVLVVVLVLGCFPIFSLNT